jgi:predicted AlkP superfamily phosphohydrolase/phosphomutase
MPTGSPLAYIDPGGGLPPSSWGMLLTALLAALGAGLTTLKLFGGHLFALLARHRRKLLAVAAALLLAGLTMPLWWFGRTEPTTTAGPRVLVLAFDGLDPRLLEQYLAEGRLPNFARLAREGLYHPLPTCMAPQSPVAWCTCITGEDAGRHGVFDFIKRDPASYRPDLALADRQKLTLPWQGTPFWERPALARLGTVAQRLPMVFPPPKLNGRLLAGMGVWDVRGTEGTYFFYSTAPEPRKDARGMLLPLTRDGDALRGELPGPYRAGGPDDIREPFTLTRTGDGFTLRLQGKDHALRAGRWSDWVSVRFGMGPLGLQKVPAVTRVLPRAEGERTTLYVSPLNFDPRAPLYPISHPRGYSAELADAIGLYATRGMPFDTHAVNDGVLTEEDFLEQVRQVTDESERMLHHELARFKSGLLFAYFEGSDIVQHLFWRGIDPEHPLHHDPSTQRHRDAIPRMYEQYDAILGRARAALGEGAAVVVMSDHGFGPFRRAVHLNAILRNLGLLVLKGGKTTSGELLRDIDWYRTKAYAVGFNALYLNRAGREGKGVVQPGEVGQALHVLTAALERWKDPGTGARPIKKVHRASELYGGKEHPHMPDLLVGYARGYRASWETALGAVPAEVCEPNRKKWSGDHCVDASEVPGIYLSSDRGLDAPSLAGLGEALDRHLAVRLAERPAAGQ